MTEPTGEVILYRRDDGAPALEVRLDAETVWLSQQQTAELFQTSRENITMHLRNVYDEGELDRAATCKDFLQVREERARTVVWAYFDAAEFRAQSHEPTRMRDWIVHLEGMIAAIGGQRLEGAGTQSHAQAKAKAEDEYAKYRAALDVPPSQVEQVYLERLKRTQRQIERNK